MCGSGGGGNNEAEEARKREDERQAKIRDGREQIDKNFNQFDDNYFSGRRQSYLDYAKPQFDDQLTDASKSLLAALSRSGLSDSSIAANRREKLAKMAGTKEREIEDKALDFENSARKAVNSAQTDLYAQNANTADPMLAANTSMNRAQTLTSLPAYSPLGALFAGVTSGLATQADLERRGQAKYGNVLFGSGSGGSGTVIGD